MAAQLLIYGWKVDIFHAGRSSKSLLHSWWRIVSGAGLTVVDETLESVLQRQQDKSVIRKKIEL